MRSGQRSRMVRDGMRKYAHQNASQQDPRGHDHDGRHGPALICGQRADRIRGRCDHLAEHDQREQAESLGDVAGVPRWASPALLQDDRHDHLGGRQQHENRDGDWGREVRDRGEHPRGLSGRDHHCVGDVDPAMVRVVAGGAQPEGDQRYPHDDVAEHHQHVVRALALRRGFEAHRQAEGQHDDADHLDQGGDPDDRIVVAVRRREPGVQLRTLPATPRSGRT